MMLVNTTFVVELAIDDEFTDWIAGTYMPAAVGECGLTDPLFTHILAPAEDGTTNYAVQCRGSEKGVETWLDGAQQRLLDEMRQRWGQKALHFTTLMEVLNG